MSIIEINAKNERTLKMYSNLIEEIQIKINLIQDFLSLKEI